MIILFGFNFSTWILSQKSYYFKRIFKYHVYDYMKIKKAFTIVELLFVIIIISLLVPMIFGIISDMHKQKVEIEAKQQVMLQGYQLFEKINVLLQNYTIDYEEYFNRTMVGCSENGEIGKDFTWNINNSGYCDLFTAYGNGNAITTETWNHDLYYMSESNWSNNIMYNRTINIKKSIQSWMQSFGQYKRLFYDMHNDTDWDKSVFWDSDDEDLGKFRGTWLEAIQNATGIQELYLISLDGKDRLYFRRKLVEQGHLTGEVNDNTRAYWTWEKLYTIQILRLKGFDAGTKHTFDYANGDTNPGIYDGYIDTWTCDASLGFKGQGSWVWWVYTDYNLPKDAEDCWVDLYQSNITLEDWNLTIYPTHNFDYARKEKKYQIHPYITLFTYNGVYLPSRQKMMFNDATNFFIPLKTTLNIKDTYFSN